MYIATILCLTTGTKKQCKIDLDWGDGSLFAWQNGSFGCDCNRHLFFTEDANEDIECSKVHYKVEKITLEDGTVIEIDK